ncbi:hypothetical protein AVEN_133734-1 [Araneus ventricosus]|uniref:Reverse transcriptase domain-containing protein n=1 Tax=Araneus ventricosus TaxID=182803 RepID=A0A4Y2B9X3_ARAVE|nr:hypothetical protein AVEN_133734-1 [Araneus ventricosus]
MTNNIGLLNNHVHTRISPCGSTSLLDLSLTSQDCTYFHVHPDCFDSDHFPISIYVESLVIFITVHEFIGILNSYQLGFLPFRDCNTALALLLQEIFTVHHLKQDVDCVSLDIASAYDSVWPDGLVYKLVSLGINGRMALWIQNFLQGWNFFVQWRNSASFPKSLNRGIPQGSVIFPILFLPHISDIHETVHDHTIGIIYAEDLWLIIQENSPNQVKRSLLPYITFKSGARTEIKHFSI